MQTKRDQWTARLAAWKASGLSQSAWCREHGVSLASFGYWRRKLAGPTGSTPSVLPIRRAPDPTVEMLEVRLPNGIVLRVPGVDLAALLRSLAAC